MQYKINQTSSLDHVKIKKKLNVTGYKLPSKKNKFIIKGSTITNIRITNKKLAHPFTSLIVSKKYLKLINDLTELLTSDDETGESCREVLNQIERFKSEIKAKYRLYLNKEELKQMANKLKILQKEAKIKEINLYENQINKGEKRVR